MQKRDKNIHINAHECYETISQKNISITEQIFK